MSPRGGEQLNYKIGFLGPKGTFTEMAARSLFPEGNCVSYPTIVSCMEAIDEDVDFSVVPIENTIEGSVPITIDYLYHKESLPIIGELTIPIEQHLMVHPNHADDWTSLKGVCSHSHAISQCHNYLTKNFPTATITPMNSTGEAAHWVSQNPGEQFGAIGNELAAELNRLTIVKNNIHDYPNNQTRFIILSKKHKELPKLQLASNHDKTTFMITPEVNIPGALHQILSAFAWRRLDLSKIESRPMKTGFGNYFFILDVEEGRNNILLNAVKEELESLGCKVSTLGNYPCFSLM
jgi:prephenate dehydratase